MKKNSLIVIATFLLQCGGVMGQMHYETALISDPVGNECGIVRSWKSSKAVAYHQHLGNVFSVIDSVTNMVYSATVVSSLPINPPTYTFNDFRIVGDTAYCGGSDGNTAIIAYFDINEISAVGSVPLDVITINNIDQVTKLAAYRNVDMNGVGIAAIGKSRNIVIPNTNKYYMIECNNYGGTYFSASSRECLIEPPIEVLTDVVATKNYVAFVGRIDNADQVCIRRGSKNGIFAYSIIDTIHRYYCPPYNIMESLPVAEALDADHIAVAAAFTEAYPTSFNQSVQTYLFDLYDMSFFDAWRSPQSEVLSVVELAYMPSPKTLLMAINLGSKDRVIYTLPYSPTDYIANYMELINEEDKICSMDFRNSSYYILSTTAYWMLQKRVFPCSSGNSCIETDKVEFFHWTVSLDNPKYYQKIWYVSSWYLDKIPQTNFLYTPDCYFQTF